MIYSGKQLVTRIRTHLKKRGGGYPAWFVGICTDAKSRLFKTHGVQKKGDCWIYVHAESPRVARSVQSFFVKKLGTAGEKAVVKESVREVVGVGVEDVGPKDDFVYAYKRSAHTKP